MRSRNVGTGTRNYRYAAEQAIDAPGGFQQVDQAGNHRIRHQLLLLGPYFIDP